MAPQTLADSDGNRPPSPSCLLQVVSPCYVRVLEEAARLLGAGDGFWQLWPPGQGLTEPWAGLARRVYAGLARSAVVWAGGRWVTPGDAVYPDGLPARDEELLKASAC